MSTAEMVEDDNEIEEPTFCPLWKYVTKAISETLLKIGGSTKFVCNFGCRTEAFTGSDSRVRQHLIGILPGKKSQGIAVCKMLSKTERDLLKAEELDAQRQFNGNSKAQKLHFPTALTSPGGSSPTNSAINNMFQINTREEVDQKVARCIYENGVVFNIVRSPLWADMVYGINNAPKGYKSPNYEKLRTTLLDKEQHKIQQSLSPLMEDWDTHGVSIVSDGWSNVKYVPLINIMAISSGKAIFMTAHDVSSIEKSGEYIAELL